MADKTLTSLVGSGAWVTKSIHINNGFIAPNVSGEVLRITPPEGCRILMTHLVATGITTEVSLFFSDRLIFSGTFNSTPSGQGSLMSTLAYGTSASIAQSSSLIQGITGKANEQFVLTAAANLGESVYYSCVIQELS